MDSATNYSKEFFKKTGEKYLYNLMPIDNLSSVFRYGILSNNKQKALGIKAKSVADVDVQERRDKVIIPNGLPLHSYANLYFTYWNPMLSRIRDDNDKICILRIDPKILNHKDVVISDMNASRSLARFYDVGNGLSALDFSTIFLKNWKAEDEFQEYLNKGIKCAEILIPQSVPPEFIIDIVVKSEDVRQKVMAVVPKRIQVVKNSGYFF